MSSFKFNAGKREENGRTRPVVMRLASANGDKPE